MMSDTCSSSRFRLDGQHVLVTGASSGLGAHFARTLADAGAAVTLAARRTDRISNLAEELRLRGAKAQSVTCDVTEPQSVEDACIAAHDGLGPVAVLVNNAGVSRDAWLVDTDDNAWRSIMDVNLDGARRMADAVARQMRVAGRGGAIINVASVLGLVVLARVGAYAVSKAALVQLTRAMALEWARDGIRVNALAPGYIPTEMNAAFLESDAGDRLKRRIPQRRFGAPDDLDGPLLLLASNAGRYMTGAVLPVDGGALLGLG